MTLGATGKHYVYTVSSENNKPLESQFTSQLGYVTSWSIRQGLNQLSDFSAEAYGITGSRRTNFKAGNYIYALSGTNLVGKFIIESPAYDTQGKTNIKAIQSTGSEIARKQASKTNTDKITYDHVSGEDILFSNTDPKGILVDSAGNYILMWSSLNATEIISMTTDYNNRIKSLNDFCDLANKEWSIKHINTGGRFFVDHVDVMNRVGSATSAYTFNLTGAGTNAKIASGAEQTLKATNDVIVKGKDINGNQVDTELFEASLVTTTLSQTLDGWLGGEISPSEQVIPLVTGHGFTGLTNFYVKIDNEIINVTSVTGNYLIIPSTGRGSKSNNISTNSIPMNHKEGSDVILINDGRQGSDMVRVSVNSTSGFGTQDIYVGSEKMRIFSAGSGYFTVTRAYTSDESAWLNSYAHSSDTYVHDYHTPDSPNTDSNSIYLKGVHTVSYTDNRAFNRDMLDKTAKRILDTKKIPSGKDGNENIEIEVAEPDVVWAALTNYGTRSAIGCKVTLANSDVINIDAGDYRIVEYQFSWPPPKLILYLNNDDVRGYSTGVTSFVEEFNDAQETERQDPTRSQDLQRQTGVGSDSQTSQLSFGQKILDGVVVPDDAWGDYEPRDYMQNAYDSNAASVGYVRALTSGLNADSYWIDNDSLSILYPWKVRDVVPYEDEGGNLGATTRRWNWLFASYGTFNGLATGDSIVDISNADVASDSLRAGKNSSGNWNFAVSGSYVSIYNGPLDMHNNYITNIGSGSSSGLQLSTSSNNNAWRLYGSTQNLILDKVTGSTGYFQINENIILNGSNPEIRFTDTSVKIYRTGNDIYFKDLVAKGGVAISLNELYTLAGGISIHTHANDSQGGSALTPASVRIGMSSSNPFVCYNMSIDTSGNINVNNQSIFNANTITFDSSPLNSIADTSTDIHIQGKEGIYLKVYAPPLAGAGIILGNSIGNIYTIRPFANNLLTTPSGQRTHLGHSSYYFHTAYVRTINLNGVERSTWPEAGTTPGLATVLGVSNSAGSYNINMNSHTISGIGYLTFYTNSENTIYGDEDDIYVNGYSGIYLTTTAGGGGVILGRSDANITTIRPWGNSVLTTPSAQRVHVGQSDHFFHTAYVRNINLNGVERSTWPSSGSTPSLSSVLAVGNSAGSYDINMNGHSISAVDIINFENSNNYISDAGNDLMIQGYSGIYLQTNTGSNTAVILGSSVGNVDAIRPYESGGVTATDLGTSTAPFTNAYINTPYVNGHRLYIQTDRPDSTAGGNKPVSVGDIWIDI